MGVTHGLIWGKVRCQMYLIHRNSQGEHVSVAVFLRCDTVFIFLSQCEINFDIGHFWQLFHSKACALTHMGSYSRTKRSVHFYGAGETREHVCTQSIGSHNLYYQNTNTFYGKQHWSILVFKMTNFHSERWASILQVHQLSATRMQATRNTVLGTPQVSRGDRSSILVCSGKKWGETREQIATYFWILRLIYIPLVPGKRN